MLRFKKVFLSSSLKAKSAKMCAHIFLKLQRLEIQLFFACHSFDVEKEFGRLLFLSTENDSSKKVELVDKVEKDDNRNRHFID
jgi:hypothetical protein